MTGVGISTVRRGSELLSPDNAEKTSESLLLTTKRLFSSRSLSGNPYPGPSMSDQSVQVESIRAKCSFEPIPGPCFITEEPDHGRSTQEVPRLGRPAVQPRAGITARCPARRRPGVLPPGSHPADRPLAVPPVLRPRAARPTAFRCNHDGHARGLRLLRGSLLQPQDCGCLRTQFGISSHRRYRSA